MVTCRCPGSVRHGEDQNGLGTHASRIAAIDEARAERLPRGEIGCQTGEVRAAGSPGGRAEDASSEQVGLRLARFWSWRPRHLGRESGAKREGRLRLADCMHAIGLSVLVCPLLRCGPCPDRGGGPRVRTAHGRTSDSSTCGQRTCSWQRVLNNPVAAPLSSPSREI